MLTFERDNKLRLSKKFHREIVPPLLKRSPTNLVGLTKKILAGDCVDTDENIFCLQAKTFEIKSSTVLTSDVDGEVGDLLPLKIETLHHAIEFFC